MIMLGIFRLKISIAVMVDIQIKMSISSIINVSTLLLDNTLSKICKLYNGNARENKLKTNVITINKTAPHFIVFLILSFKVFTGLLDCIDMMNPQVNLNNELQVVD
jgi:hypothetical protein